MNPSGAPPDLETIETALGQFSVSVSNGGKRLFEESLVRYLNESALDNTDPRNINKKNDKK